MRLIIRMVPYVSSDPNVDSMEGLGIRTPMIFSQGYILMSVFNRTYVSVISFIRGLNILGFIISKSVEHTL